jgi:hypothetical protein
MRFVTKTKSDKMALQKTGATERTGLEIGQKEATRAEAMANMRPGMAFASLGQARRIRAIGLYWISAESKRIGEGTYRGVPAVTGYYRDNGDGTFTSVLHKNTERWSDLLHVSYEAAERAASGDGPVALGVGRYNSSRLTVSSLTTDWPGGSKAKAVYVKQEKPGVAGRALAAVRRAASRAGPKEAAGEALRKK